MANKKSFQMWEDGKVVERERGGRSQMPRKIPETLIETFMQKKAQEEQINDQPSTLDDLFTMLQQSTYRDEAGSQIDKVQRLVREYKDESMKHDLIDFFRMGIGTPQEQAEIMLDPADGSREYVHMGVAGDENKYSSMPRPERKKNIFGKPGFSYMPPVRPELANALNALQQINYEGDPDSFINELIQSGVVPGYDFEKDF